MVNPAPNVSVEKLARRTEKLDENDRKMGDNIDELLEIQREQTATLHRHAFALGEHGKILTRHTGLLEEHSTVLARHGEMLEDQSATLTTHTVLLHDLDTGVRLNGHGINDTKRAIKELNKLHVDHSRKLEDLGRFVSRQEAFNADVESKVATIMGDVTELKGDVTELKIKVAGLDEKVVRLDEKLDMILTRLPAH